MPLPNIVSLERARTAAWIVAAGGIAGFAFLPADWDGLRLILFFVFMLDGVILLVLRSWIRKRLPAPLPPAREVSERSLIFVVIVVLTWALIDAFFLGQGFISLILCVAGVLYFPLRAMAARKDSARFRLRLSKAAITSVAGFAALGTIVYGNVIARERAEKLIVAVEQFHAKHGRYPERLEQVVPVFIAEIPRAKYVLTAEKFSYFARDSSHWLMYVEVPPFGRRTYTFEDHKWTSLD